MWWVFALAAIVYIACTELTLPVAIAVIGVAFFAACAGVALTCPRCLEDDAVFKTPCL